jgi:CubicO group peptidase (beta-lactamase class C family)
MRFMARAMLPGGGLFATLDDLLVFGRVLLRTASGHHDETVPRLMSAITLAEMVREQTAGLEESLDDGTTRPPRWALGWARPRPGWPGGPAVFTHGGATGGRLWVDPEAGFAFAFLTSLWGAPDEPGFDVLREVYRAVEAQRPPSAS